MNISGSLLNYRVTKELKTIFES